MSRQGRGAHLEVSVVVGRVGVGHEHADVLADELRLLVAKKAGGVGVGEHDLALVVRHDRREQQVLEQREARRQAGVGRRARHRRRGRGAARDRALHLGEGAGEHVALPAARVGHGQIEGDQAAVLAAPLHDTTL